MASSWIERAYGETPPTPQQTAFDALRSQLQWPSAASPASVYRGVYPTDPITGQTHPSIAQTLAAMGPSHTVAKVDGRPPPTVTSNASEGGLVLTPLYGSPSAVSPTSSKAAEAITQVVKAAPPNPVGYDSGTVKTDNSRLLPQGALSFAGGVTSPTLTAAGSPVLNADPIGAMPHFADLWDFRPYRSPAQIGEPDWSVANAGLPGTASNPNGPLVKAPIDAATIAAANRFGASDINRPGSLTNFLARLFLGGGGGVDHSAAPTATVTAITNGVASPASLPYYTTAASAENGGPLQNWNPAVYEANKAAVDGGLLTASSINQAASQGRTVYRP